MDDTTTTVLLAGLVGLVLWLALRPQPVPQVIIQEEKKGFIEQAMSLTGQAIESFIN